MPPAPGARPPRPQPSRRPAPAPPKKKGTPPLYYAIAGGAFLLLVGGFAFYMNNLFKTKERLVRDADRLVEEDRKLRASMPPPAPPKPPPPATPEAAKPRPPATPTPLEPPPSAIPEPPKPPPPATPVPPAPAPAAKRVEGVLPASPLYRNEQHRFRLRIKEGFLVQTAEDPDFLQLAHPQGKLRVTARMVTPPSTIAQGWDRYLSLIKSEYPSMFPDFKLGNTRTEISGALPALYIAFTCNNSAGQRVGAAQYFVAAKDRMVVVSFNAPTPFDRELNDLVADITQAVRLESP